MARTKNKLGNNSIDSNVFVLQKLESELLKAKRENFMRVTEHDDSFLLTPLQDYKKGESYFLQLQQKDYVLLPEETFCRLLDLLHASYEERYCMQLEREIARHLPRDFDDIWEVAIEEIKKSNKGFLNIDPESLVLSIKKQHPNLFMRLDFDF